jgi:cytoskeletal protein RodZ
MSVGAFGERLKHEREKRKISLDEVSNATKISTRMLRAIEQEQFGLLPGGIFNKSFVRSYARHLGLNEDEIVANYLEVVRANEPQEQNGSTPEAEARKIMEQRALLVLPARQRTVAQVPWSIVALALLLLALGLALWNLRSRPGASSVGGPVNAVSNSKPISEAPIPPSTTETPKPTAEATPPAAVSPDVGTQPAGSFRVIIRAREDSWIQITADGKEILEDTILGETQRMVDARNELIIKAGNVGGLDFWFNGQKLPTQGDQAQVKTLTFDSTGLVTTATPIQPVPTALER